MDKKVDYSTYMQSTIEMSDILNDITNFIIENSSVIIEANKKDIESIFFRNANAARYTIIIFIAAQTVI